MHLTDREIEVCKCLISGMNNNEIAAKLFISRHTVKAYISNILVSLKAKNRTEVAYILGKKNIIDL